MSFLALPGELRNAIYDAVLFPHHDYVAVVHCSQHKDLAATIFNSPLLRVSSQVRNEALARLYKTKTLKIVNLPTATMFLNYVGTVGENNITELVLCDPFWYRWLHHTGTYLLLGSLGRMTQLKKLTLKMPQQSDKEKNSAGFGKWVKMKEALESRGCEVDFEWLMLPLLQFF